MKILFVLEYYYPNIGGVETLFKTLAESLVQKGNEVQVITMRFDPELPKEELINGVKVKRLGLTNRLFFALFSVFKVVGAARYFDLIHTTSSSAGFPASVAGLITSKQVIITYHELWGKLWFKLPYMDFMTKTINYLFEQIISKLPYNKIVAVSDFTKESLVVAGMSTRKITRIYNGIDYDKFKGITCKPTAEFTFTFFGRLGASKGLDILLPAAAKFFKKKRDTKLRLIIPTIPKANYRKVIHQIEQLNISGQTEIFSNLSSTELMKQLCSSHCVVIPSYSEGFCFAAVEAIAMGIPIISSDQGALKETVSGKFVKMSALSPDALSESLEKARKNAWMTSPIRKFDLDTQVKSYESLYISMFRKEKV